MFGNLLGKAASPEKKKEGTMEELPIIHDKVGWADNDLDIEVDSLPRNKEPEFEEVPEVKQIEPEEELDLPPDITKDVS